MVPFVSEVPGFSTNEHCGYPYKNTNRLPVTCLWSRTWRPLLLPALFVSGEVLIEMPDGGENPDLRINRYKNVNVDLSARKSITFSVKTRNDAHILLSLEGATHVEVMLGRGNNTDSVIGNQNGSKTVRTEGILDPWSYQDFWISWDQNIIKVGQGSDVQQCMFMEKDYNPVSLNFKHMGVWNGFGSPGVWKINAGEFTLKFYNFFKV